MALLKISNQQLEIEQLLSENQTINQGMIDEVMGRIQAIENAAKDDGYYYEHIGKKQAEDKLIKLQLMDETLDWRKRASLSAMLISRSLEDY